MKLFKNVLKNNLKIMIVYLLTGVVITFLELYSITYFQKILDSFQFKRMNLLPLLIYGILLIVITIIRYFDNYPEQKLKHKLYLDFKLQSLEKMKTIDYLEYQKIGTGKLIQKIEDGSTASRDILLNYYLKLFRLLIPTTLFSIFFLFNVEKRLILFVILGYILVLIISKLLMRFLYKLKEGILFDKELFNKHLVRSFMELVVFRTNKKYDSEIELCNKGLKNIVNKKTKIKLVHEVFFTSFALIVNILKVIILAYAVLKTDLSVAAIVTTLMLIERAYEPIAIFNVEYIDYNLNKITVKKYIELLEAKDDLALTKGRTLKISKGEIEFKNVSFSYNNNQVLNNLSFKIQPNSTCLFKGASGTGKSTIAKLILGLIKPSSGQILIDKQNLDDLTLNSVYEEVSYISQETPIFDGTLRENIIFNKKVEENEIYEVLKLVSLEEFYLKLNDGLNTELGEKGVKISGGEKQRVALARLYFDDSKVLILDEATSALDLKTESFVLNNLTKHLRNKTIIIISHHPNVLKNIDKTLCL